MQDAIKGCRPPIFGPDFYQTGHTVAATGRAPQRAVDNLQRALQSIRTYSIFVLSIQALPGSDYFKEYILQYSGLLTRSKG